MDNYGGAGLTPPETPPDLDRQSSQTTHAYRGWRVVGAFVAAMLLAAFGARLAITGASSFVQFGGAALGLPLAALTTYCLWRACRRFRQLYRAHRSRCIHCGYPTAGYATSLCPECGRNPVE